MYSRVASYSNAVFLVCLSNTFLQAQPPTSNTDGKEPGPALSETLGITELQESYGGFQLFSEQALLRDVSSRIPAMRIPRLDDDFNRADSPTLGNLWRTGTEAAGAAIGISNNQAVAQGRLIAFADDQVPSADVRLSVRIVMTPGATEAGVIFRGSEPAGMQGFFDHEFVRLRSDGVTVGSVQSGVETLAPVIPLTATFPLVLTVTAQGAEIRVSIDARDVATVHQRPLAGRLAGIWADGDVAFDDFQATSYHRPALPRNYFDNLRCTPSPFVTYRPIYGQHVMIERYGQHFGNCVQPIVEQLKFGADAALLPIRALRFPPWYCDSNACYYPPGVPVLPLRITGLH